VHFFGLKFKVLRFKVVKKEIRMPWGHSSHLHISIMPSLFSQNLNQCVNHIMNFCALQVAIFIQHNLAVGAKETIE